MARLKTVQTKTGKLEPKTMAPDGTKEKKKSRHKPGVARAIATRKLRKSGNSVIRRLPFTRMVRNLMAKESDGLRLTKDFVSSLIMWVEKEAEAALNGARLYAAVAGRQGVRASDLQATLALMRPGMDINQFQTTLRGLCEEACSRIYPQGSAESRVKVIDVSVTRQWTDLMPLLVAVKFYVVWPVDIPLNMLKRSIWLGITESGHYYPERQRTAVLEAYRALAQNLPLPEAFKHLEFREGFLPKETPPAPVAEKPKAVVAKKPKAKPAPAADPEATVQFEEEDASSDQ